MPYEAMRFPEERVQVDVKHVPLRCMATDVLETRFYQYAAIDEFSRFRYVEAFDALSTMNSERFLMNMLRKFPFEVLTVQTDNGPEFTNRFTPYETFFEYGDVDHELRPYTLRRHRKMERVHHRSNAWIYP